MARINPELARQAGESTLAYLTRVRTKMPSLPIPLIQKIAYMHEAARFRPQVCSTAILCLSSVNCG
ncbi:unnamed protein product [Heligmosomoides polygyrus]|uniref:Uncharacterized protein n=1 Tax=Heligmosomoides polygyrus TaxID=6339 RepID=A0A3P8E8Z9_HELPZ|nr:unnamed protein product [Heligmosomoides polygyrus]